MENCLRLFDTETAAWFAETLGQPTPVQEVSWPAIAAGEHVLVSAPTGTGKTLSAFLVFLDKFRKMAAEGTLKKQLYLIYVSPLKSLAADIRENLKRPLAGIAGGEMISVGVRTGDTTQKERTRMIRRPPHILIITPESLYLMLTSKTGQNILCTAQAVIVDELHALIDTKRGAHLMLSLARLDILCGKALQRIGLSATISPLTAAAQYLAPETVCIAAPSMEKKSRLQILGSYVDVKKRKKDPLWQELSALVYHYCEGKRSVIAFVEGRRYAEKLAYYVNQMGGEDFARVHHGSLSKEQRQETEQALREGRLRLLCATSSMELGIDVGEIDEVLQVGCPRTISSTMQRLGRAGHNPFRTSYMYFFPRTPAESLLCGMTARLAQEGYVERTDPPEGCLDILAQHLVSMAAFRSYEVDDVMKILPRAWPFRNVTKEDVKSVLGMLAGDYEHKRDVPVRPRVLYDRIHERVEGDGYSRMLAISAGGTIPDKGLYTVRTQEGVKIGEADEEFIYESRLGDRFILGAFAWKITDIGKDTVTVVQAPVEGARLPFWKGEIKGRNKETGVRFGRFLRELQTAKERGRLYEALSDMGLDDSAAGLAGNYLKRQIEQTGALPDDKTIIVEHFTDRSGNSQLMFHSVFGRRINAPLALLTARCLKDELGIEAGCVDEEDGFLIYSYGERPLPERAIERIVPEKAEALMEILLPSTPLFNMAFRYNCGRALMMGVRGRSRQPLWMQRLRSSEMLEQVVRENDHPLIRETRSECMRHLWDAEGVKEILYQIRAGEIVVREIYTETPSPMSLPLQWAQEAAVMYDYAPTPGGIHAAVEEALRREKQMPAPDEAQLHEIQTDMRERRKIPEDERQLHSLLMTEGDLAAGELDVPVEWLEKLANDGRVIYLEQGLWIAAEQEEEYRMALAEADHADRKRPAASGDKTEPGLAVNEEALHIVRRMLRYRKAADVRQTALRYGWQEGTAREVLEELCRRKEAVMQGELYYHSTVYERAGIRMIKKRRQEITTCPSSAYAALLLSRIRQNAPPAQCLRETLLALSGMSCAAPLWEEVIFPARVANYREMMLDNLLASGEFCWHMNKEGRLRFDETSQIDWEVPAAGCLDEAAAQSGEAALQPLTEAECLLIETLERRGASFAQALGAVLPEGSPYDALLSLTEKGLVNADSFLPVRLLLNKKKIEKAVVRQRVGARVKAMHAGRFDLARPLKDLTIQEQIECCFDRYLILCRETAAACGLSWQEALTLLRVWEYTGQVRRGYFAKGLSGAQFLRTKDFEGVVSALRSPRGEIVWSNAADPMQPWGKILPHLPGRDFMNVPGTAVAFRGGVPAAAFERQGRTLRLLGTDEGQGETKEILRLFAEEYKAGRIFAAKKRIVVSEYPAETAEILAESGFMREMQDYVLYR